MKKFTISAILDEQKNLTVTNDANQNQGENRCTDMEISVPQELAENCEFYLEFRCPQNKRYISPKLTQKTSEQADAQVKVFCCELPSCVLQNEGYVQFQLVARDLTDKSVVYKSNHSNQASFFVRQSVNATETYSAIDFFVQTEAAVTSHTQNTANPHCVTKEQVGLGNVENIPDSQRSVAAAVQAEQDGAGNVITETYATKEENAEVSAVANAAMQTCAKQPCVMVFDTEQGMITRLKHAPQTEFRVGDLFFVREADSPDYWVSAVAETDSGETGYFVLSALEAALPDLSNYVMKNEELDGPSNSVVDTINRHTAEVSALEARASATEAAIAEKVDKVEGKGLSTNDFTDADSTRLHGLSDVADITRFDYYCENISDVSVGIDGIRWKNGCELTVTGKADPVESLAEMHVPIVAGTGIDLSANGDTVEVALDQSVLPPSGEFIEAQVDVGTYVYATDADFRGTVDFTLSGATFPASNKIVFGYIKNPVTHSVQNSCVFAVPNNTYCVLGRAVLTGSFAVVTTQFIDMMQMILSTRVSFFVPYRNGSFFFGVKECETAYNGQATAICLPTQTRGE